jgi:hypothetical protein
MANESETETEIVVDKPEAARETPIEIKLAGVLQALQHLATAELAQGPSIASNAWRALHDAVVDALGGEQLAQAVPVPGRPAFVIPPARGGATLVPHRPPMAVPPTPRGPIPVGAPVRADAAPVSVVPPGDIRKREDVAAELARVNEKTKRGK